TTADNEFAIISNVSVTNITSNQATITWTTNEETDSFVDFGLNRNYGTVRGIYESVVNHSVLLTDLSPDTVYYFQIKVRDQGGNLTVWETVDNQSSFTTLTSPTDNLPPAITGIESDNITYNSAVVSWITNEDATSLVMYGASIDYENYQGKQGLNQNHSINITGLSSETKYYFKIQSKDLIGNESQTENYEFTTGQAPVQETQTTSGGGGVIIIQGPEIDKIAPIMSQIKVENISDSAAVIKWETNELTDSFIEYGLTQKYEQGILGNIYDLTASHSFNLLPLDMETTYHFRVLGKDQSGNLGYSDNNTFTTLGAGASESKIETEAEKNITQELEENLVGKIINILNKLKSPYSISSVFKSFEESANRIINPPLITGENPIVEIGPDWAKISWITDKESNSVIAFAEKKDYNQQEELYTIEVGNFEEKVILHSVELTNLKPATEYNYQVRSKAEIGGWSESPNQTFLTASIFPEILDLKLISIQETEVELTWKTSLPTKSEVEVIDVKTGEKVIQKFPSFQREHLETIKNLQPFTDYTLQIKIQDEIENQSFSSIMPFSTSISKNPPIIFNVRVKTSLIPGKVEKVQVIISWQTDKPATSRIYYQEGLSNKQELANSTLLDKELVLKHNVVNTSFSQGKVYQFKIESIDGFNNKSYSKNYVVLTPKPKESIIDLIVKHFEQTFGFLKKIKM
ncbi:fibronectin type III domain-containing protein, partial [Patescibacteria group bacterium]|nr:fibronectin type III domain-containing protein [Patescibacteria group bacterium]